VENIVKNVAIGGALNCTPLRGSEWKTNCHKPIDRNYYDIPNGYSEKHETKEEIFFTNEPTVLVHCIRVPRHQPSLKDNEQLELIPDC
jgi:hypothetical protein